MAGPFAQSFRVPLNPKFLATGGAVAIEITDANTDADVYRALLKGEPFPARADGRIPLGRVSANAELGRPVAFAVGPTAVSFKPFGGAFAEMGVYDDADRALAELPPDPPADLDLKVGAAAGSRYLAMRWGWNAGASGSVKHPLGMLGSATFSASGSAAQFFGLIHRFAPETAAGDAVKAAAGSWCLPRQVLGEDDSIALAPGTWVLYESSGSFSASLKAQLGYDLSLVHDVALPGAVRNLGVRIDAAASATLGFNVAGRFLLVAGRESSDENSKSVRLRLFKLDTHGWNFGLNLGVGIQADSGLPDKIDDFVQSVFGVHGPQVVRDLAAIEKWTEKSLAESAARLTRRTGLDLLARVTGIDPATKFETSRQALAGVLQKWIKLPDALQSRVWSIVAGGGEGHLTALLQSLIVADPNDRAEAFGAALGKAAFGDSIEGQFLGAAGQFGLLLTAPQIDQVRKLADQTLAALEGGAMGRLVTFVRERLAIASLAKPDMKKPEFDAIDGWLIARLEDLFGKTLGFNDLEEIRKAIHAVVSVRQKVYERALQALHHRFAVDIAATYRKSATGTALLDMTFDLAQASARDLWREVIEGDFDRALSREVDGVTLRQGALTHSITRETTVQVQLPFFNSKVEHLNETLASLDAETNGGRVLVYAVNAKDTVRDRSRFLSELSIAGGFRVENGKLVTSSAEGQSISYHYRQAKARMKVSDFRNRVTPFIRFYLGDQFSGPDAIGTFLLELDRTVEALLHNGQNDFGDVLYSMELEVPAEALASWLRPLGEEAATRAKLDMSKRIQTAVRRLLPAYYFDDPGHLNQDGAAAALLLWSCLPVSTSIDVDHSARRLTLDTGKGVFWNWPDKDLRKALAGLDSTVARLTRALDGHHERLLSDGLRSQAKFFEPEELSDWRTAALSAGIAQADLEALLSMESRLVNGAAEAVDLAQAALKAAPDQPREAVKVLAEAGGKLTEVFHDRVKSIYGDQSSRAIGSALLLEATSALDPVFAARKPRAALSITVLDPRSSFAIADYIAGKSPLQKDVAVYQTLVSD